MMKGARLAKMWRKARDLSQKEAAATVGLMQSTWSRLEAGGYVPRADEALRLEKASRGAVPCSGWVEEAAPAADSGTTLPADRPSKAG